MIRIALFILLLIIIIVAVKFPNFRRILGVIFFLLMGAIGVVIWQDSVEREMEFERISTEQTKLLQMQVRPGLNSRSFVIRGRLQNLAKDYTILSIQLQATVRDCDGGDCEIVGQEEIAVPLEVPSSQSRDFSVTIPFSVAPEVKGEADWEYAVLKVRAR